VKEKTNAGTPQQHHNFVVVLLETKKRDPAMKEREKQSWIEASMRAAFHRCSAPKS
jgi:hypothetical protein